MTIVDIHGLGVDFHDSQQKDFHFSNATNCEVTKGVSSVEPNDSANETDGT